MKVALHTLGCRTNQTETFEIQNIFANNGYKIVTEDADIVFINTCSVTHRVDATCRNLVTKLKKTGAFVIVAGCGSDKFKDKVDLVLDNNNKFSVVDYLLGKESRTREFYGGMILRSDNHTRSFIKVEDGCDSFCSYCIVPFFRGVPRFMDISEFKERVKLIISSGSKEIVLTGINLGLHSNLLKMIEILDNSKIERIRLSSINPDHLTTDFIKSLSGFSKLMPHLHISLQSGSSEVLKAMKRKYDVSFLCDMFFKINQFLPNFIIGSDIIAGFPSETDDYFKQSFEFLKSNENLVYLHIFPYSLRTGTAASNMKQLDESIKKDRVLRLRSLAKSKMNSFKQRLIGKTRKILFEKWEDGFNYGHTEDYLAVRCEGINSKNEIKELEISENNFY